MAVKLPMVLCSNNVDTPLGLQEEFPGRVGTLLTPGHWRDPTGVPFALDNGRYSSGRAKKPWSEKKFLDMINLAKRVGHPPLWLAVPDVIGNYEETLRDWKVWALRLKTLCDWNLALVAQPGMTPEMVKALSLLPDVLFIGGGTDW